MWQDASGARAILVQSARPVDGRDEDIHLCALRALQALSVEAANKAPMWQQSDLRVALTESAMLKQDHKVRICALSTLKNISTDSSNMVGIWNDSTCRTALLAAAAAPEVAADEDATSGRVRAIALGALRNIAAAEDNKRPMWADERGARAAILAAAAIASDKHLSADAREAREHAMAALRHFSVSSEAHDGPSDPLWKDSAEAQAALLAASRLSTVEPSDRKARDYAVAALRHAVA